MNIHLLHICLLKPGRTSGKGVSIDSRRTVYDVKRSKNAAKKGRVQCPSPLHVFLWVRPYAVGSVRPWAWLDVDAHVPLVCPQEPVRVGDESNVRIAAAGDVFQHYSVSVRWERAPGLRGRAAARGILRVVDAACVFVFVFFLVPYRFV